MMRRAILCLFFFCSCFAEDYKSILLKAMQEHQIPGLAVALYSDHRSKLDAFGVANKQTGKPVDRNTIFNLASITKVFTSTAVALAVINGQMKLTDPVTVYLPKQEHYQDIKNVTIKSLLTHTSGLPRGPPITRFEQGRSFEEILQFLFQWQAAYPAEQRYLYSNLGFGILGYALTNAEKMPYRVTIKQQILNPLRMNATFFEVPPASLKDYAQGYRPDNLEAARIHMNVLPASGALHSTSADMLNFLMANLGVSGPRNLQNAMQLTHREFFVVNSTFSMGLGWQRVKRENRLIIDKNGNVPGFSSYIGMIPYQKIGIVLLANKAGVPLTKIGRRILLQLAK